MATTAAGWSPPGSTADADVTPVTSVLDVRGTTVRLQRAGDGAPLLFLHGAGAGGRWLSFHEALAGRFGVMAPTHPGHGGSPASARPRSCSGASTIG